MSLSSNLSPQFGQNFGGLAGSSGSHPHLSHLYFGNPAGFFAPQFAQKLPLLLAPQEQIQPSGFALPQFGQKLPLTSVPQSHFHPPAAGAA